MLPWGQNRRVIEVFSNQFESDGRGGYLFRRNGMGPAFPISAADRDRFVAAYKRGWRRITWIIFFGALIMIGIATGAALLLDKVSELLLDLAFAAGVIPLVIWTILWDRRMRLVPVHFVAGRATVGNARSREEATERHFARLRWSHIAAIGAGSIVSIASLARQIDIMHGWGRLWLLGGVAIFVMMIYVAVRKWQTISG